MMKNLPKLPRNKGNRKPPALKVGDVISGYEILAIKEVATTAAKDVYHVKFLCCGKEDENRKYHSLTSRVSRKQTKCPTCQRIESNKKEEVEKPAGVFDLTGHYWPSLNN
jgi:hypothetical protein